MQPVRSLWKHLYAAVHSLLHTPTAPAVFTKGKEKLNGSQRATKFKKTDKFKPDGLNGAEKNKAEVLAIKGFMLSSANTKGF